MKRKIDIRGLSEKKLNLYDKNQSKLIDKIILIEGYIPNGLAQTSKKRI